LFSGPLIPHAWSRTPTLAQRIFNQEREIESKPVDPWLAKNPRGLPTNSPTKMKPDRNASRVSTASHSDAGGPANQTAKDKTGKSKKVLTRFCHFW
jgi:hypothetical protein